MSLWSLAHENVIKNGGIFESDRKYSPGVVIRLWWLQPGLQLSLAARLSDWQGELLTLTSCLARLVRREERQTELGRCHFEVTVRSLSHWVTSACPAPLAARARLSWAWLAAPPPGALSSEHQAGGNSFNNVPEGYNTTQHDTTHTQLGWQHQAALLLTTLWKVVSLHARKVRFIPRNSLLSSIIKHNLYFCWRL